MNVNNYLIKADQFCDFVPGLSTANNIVDLFLKCVVLPCMEKASIAKSHYFTQLKDKSFVRCAVLLVPLIGNIAVFLYDRYNAPDVKVEKIDRDFTSKKSIEDQRAAHTTAIGYLKNELSKIGAEFACVSHTKTDSPLLKDVTIEQNLDPAVFKAQYTRGVKEDIIADGKRPKECEVVYGAASQFNGCEAPAKYTIEPGQAAQVYENDRTQGPQAQLAFGNKQVEIINNGGNLGFNGLCNLLDDETKSEIAHGYFTPRAANGGKVIDMLRNGGDRIQYPVVANAPIGGNNRVHLFLVAAPAFGMYTEDASVGGEEKNEVQFLCALNGFRAQFQKCVDLAKATKSPVCFKPAAVGLGVFDNAPKIVAKGFYVAAKEYERELKENRVEVYFQIFNRGNPDRNASLVAQELGLQFV